MLQILIQRLDGGAELPLRLVANANTVARTSDLQKGQTCLQTGKMKRRTFHGFQSGTDVLQMHDVTGRGTDLVHGDCVCQRKSRLLQQSFMRIAEPALVKRGLILVLQFQIKDVAELIIFPNPQIGQAVFFDRHQLSGRPVMAEITRHAGLDHQLRAYFGKMTAHPPAAHQAANARKARDNHVSTRLVLIFFEPVEQGGQFGPCGRQKQDAHTANIRKPRHSQPNCTFAGIYKAMVYLTRSEHFNAAHKLYNPNWSAEQNEAMFGKCANENWHGHNYELLVTVKGVPDPGTGFVFDVKRLSTIIKEHIIEKLDHRNLNLDVEFMKGKMCSTENLAIAIWQQLVPHLPASVQLHAIKLYETPRIYVEYFGE